MNDKSMGNNFGCITMRIKKNNKLKSETALISNSLDCDWVVGLSTHMKRRCTGDNATTQQISLTCHIQFLFKLT